MEGTTINITGGVNINLGTTEKKQDEPSMKVTPFLKAAFIDIPNELLLFNVHVSRQLKKIDSTMVEEKIERLRELSDLLETIARGDYSPDTLTEYGAEIAAIAAAMVFHFGGELAVKNG